MPEFKQKNDVESQLSPIEETSTQVSGSSTEQSPESQTGNTLVKNLNDSKEPQPEIQRHEMNITANDIGDDDLTPPKTTASQIEEQLATDDVTNELYTPLPSTIILKLKKEMLYDPLDFENGLKIDALVDSGAYVSAIAQTELDRIKQQAPPTSSNSTTLPIFKSKCRKWPVGETHINSHSWIWYGRQHLCRALRRNGWIDRTHYRAALHETQ